MLGLHPVYFFEENFQVPLALPSLGSTALESLVLPEGTLLVSVGTLSFWNAFVNSPSAAKTPLPSPYLLPPVFDLQSPKASLFLLDPSSSISCASLILEVPLRSSRPSAEGGSSLFFRTQGVRSPSEC